MIDGVQFGEFDEWLSLPIGARRDDVVAHLLDRFAADPRPDHLKAAIAEQLVQLGDQLTGKPSPDLAVFSVWLLLPEGGQEMGILGVVVGALMPVEPGTTTSEFIETVTGGVELYQPIDLREVESPLGTAHLVRARTHSKSDHGLQVSETITTFWLPENNDEAVVLTTLPIEDLVEAADVASALADLAATASPMDSPTR